MVGFTFDKNIFGKKVFKKEYKNTNDINAGNCTIIKPNETDITEYAPFNHLIIQNKNENCTIQVVLDASYDGSNNIQGGTETFFLLPSSALEIEPKDNILYRWLIVKNLDSSNNISANEIVCLIANH